MIIIITIIIFILIFYNIIKPNNNPATYNFSSFPNISPKYLPDSSTSQPNCFNSIQECPDGSCVQCDSPNNTFTCTIITPDQPRYYITNDQQVTIPVPYNKPVCLPNINKSSTNYCNTYTGSWKWTNNSNCGDDKSQCWGCYCNYPSLYNNTQNGCETQIACQPLNEDIIVQDNKLVLSNAGASYLNSLLPRPDPPYQAGQIYDPVNGDGGVDSTLLLINPLSLDDKQNSIFECNCVQYYNSIPQIQTPLPNDPYACHKDLCWPKEFVLQTATVENNSINCNCTNGGGITIGGDGNKAGTCYTDNFCSSGSGADGGLCEVGGFCNDKNKCDYCTCITEYSQIKCNSSNYKWPPQDNVTRECCNEENPIGYECVNPCNPSPCAEGLVCEIDKNDPAVAKCECPTLIKNDLDGNPITLVSSIDTKFGCIYKWPVGSKVYKSDYVNQYGYDYYLCYYDEPIEYYGCNIDIGNCCESGHIDVTLEQWYPAYSANGVCNNDDTHDGGVCIYNYI